MEFLDRAKETTKVTHDNQWITTCTRLNRTQHTEDRRTDTHTHTGPNKLYNFYKTTDTGLKKDVSCWIPSKQYLCLFISFSVQMDHLKTIKTQQSCLLKNCQCLPLECKRTAAYSVWPSSPYIRYYSIVRHTHTHAHNMCKQQIGMHKPSSTNIHANGITKIKRPTTIKSETLPFNRFVGFVLRFYVCVSFYYGSISIFSVFFHEGICIRCISCAFLLVFGFVLSLLVPLVFSCGPVRHSSGVSYSRWLFLCPFCSRLAQIFSEYYLFRWPIS